MVSLAIQSILAENLQSRRENGSLRRLSCETGLIDFCSNDYLGLAMSADLKKLIIERFTECEHNALLTGSTGSRLLTGNTKYIEELEDSIARFHHAEAGLIFNSGYDANTGLFSCLPRRGDTIIYDELIHASVRDGIRLSTAKAFSFRHNDVYDLEKKFHHSTGQTFVTVESVYSMDGDIAPLSHIATLCAKHNAALIVDEAHATGVFGIKGEGLVYQMGLCDSVFARVHTFGKALGCFGAIVLGSRFLREYLINFSRSFIFTTALPMQNLIAINCAYEMMQENSDKIRKTLSLSALLKQKLIDISIERGTYQYEGSDSLIHSLIIPGNEKVRSIAKELQKNGFDVRSVLSPTVAAGKEMLRICVHAFNNEKQVLDMVSVLKPE